MEVDLLDNPLFISSYGNDCFIINKITYKGSLIITSDGPNEIEISENNIFNNKIIDDIFNASKSIDLLLFGTGLNIINPNQDTMVKFFDKNINIDVMKTSSACRTWNILVSENRRVAAILRAIN